MSDVVLSTKNLCAYWNKKQIIFDCSFDLHRSQILAVCGPNGSGKSTLLNCLSGLSVENLDYDKNRIYIDEKSLSFYKEKALAKKIAYLLQNEEMAWNYTVEDLILTGRYSHCNGFYSKSDYSFVKDIMTYLKIEAFKDRRIFNLSGGELQKVRIARCLSQEPEVILLDEPFVGLDFVYQAELIELLKKLSVQEKKSIVITIHDLNIVPSLTNHLMLLPRQKKCIPGETEVLLKSGILKEVYGCNFGFYNHPQYGYTQVYLEHSSVHKE